MLRKLAILLSFCFLFTFISACQNKTGSVVAQPDVREIPKIDMGGFNMIYTAGPDMGVPDGSPFGYLPDSTFADSAYAQIDKIENAFNCKIELKYTLKDSMASEINTATLAGDLYSDVLDVEDGVIIDMAKADLLVPMKDVSDIIDIYDAKKWGTPGMLEAVMLDSQVYAVRASYWPGRYPAFAAPIIFNQDITAAAGHADPREYVEQGKWDRDMFIKLIQDCTQKDENGTTIYGMSTNSTYMFEMAIRTNNGTIVKKVGDSYVNATGEKENLDALNWTVDMLKNNPDCFFNGGKAAARELFMDTFTDGKAAMFMHPTWALFTIIGMNVNNWGILPFPNGPERPNGDWVGYLAGNRNFIGISGNSTNIEYTANILNELYEPLDAYPTYESLMDYYEHYLFHDKRDLDLYFEMADKSGYNYWYGGGYLISDTLSASFDKKTPLEVVESCSSQFQTMIDEYVAGNKPFFENLENIQVQK